MPSDAEEEEEQEGDEQEKDERPRILHCFADMGVESEVLEGYGDVVRVGIDARDTNESEPITADANDLPFCEDVQFDLGVFHPICSKWADTTSISGEPDDHPNQIPLARNIAVQHCDHWIIENKPGAPLKDPVVLEGRMFGLPIAYKRGFETSFEVEQPPHVGSLDEKAETSPFFFSERSHEWWASVKGYRADRYPKQHLAKNSIPAPYIHHLCRAWLIAREDGTEEAVARPDYSDYDLRMETDRRSRANRSLEDFSVSDE